MTDYGFASDSKSMQLLAFFQSTCWRHQFNCVKKKIIWTLSIVVLHSKQVIYSLTPTASSSYGVDVQYVCSEPNTQWTRRPSCSEGNRQLVSVLHFFFSLCWPGLSGQSLNVDPNNRLSSAPHPLAAGFGARFLLRNSLNEFFLMSSFFLFSPPCLPADILSFNSSLAWQEWRERGREWEGEGMDGERKKVCSSIKRLSLETGGNTLTLPCAFWWCLLCFMNSMIHNSSRSVLSPLLPLLFSPSFPSSTLGRLPLLWHVCANVSHDNLPFVL